MILHDRIISEIFCSVYFFLFCLLGRNFGEENKKDNIVTMVVIYFEVEH